MLVVSQGAIRFLNKNFGLGLIAIIAISVSSLSWGANYLYRYKDDKGTVVINHSIPPEYVQRGYTILRKNGTVHRTVPPAMTEEQKAKLDSSKRAELERAEKKKVQEAQDAQLLRTFSRAEDAERARDRKLAALDVIIDITNGNIARLMMEYEGGESRAASLERLGKNVPQAILDNLESIERQIEEAKSFAQEKQDEKQDVNALYQGYVERLRVLNGEQSKQLTTND